MDGKEVMVELAEIGDYPSSIDTLTCVLFYPLNNATGKLVAFIDKKTKANR